MLRGDTAGQEVERQKGARLLLGRQRMEVGPCGAAEPARLDVHEDGGVVDRPDRLRGAHHAANDLEEDPHVSRIAAKIRRPEPALAAEERGHDRLVERSVPVHQAAVARGKGGGVRRDHLGVGVTREFAAQPERAPVVYQVDDGEDAEGLDEIRNHLVGPAPVELTFERLDAVPGDAPPDGADTELTGEREIGVPILVVFHQCVLVQRPMAGPRLRHERVFDAGGPEKIRGAMAEYAHGREVAGPCGLAGHRLLRLNAWGKLSSSRCRS